MKKMYSYLFPVMMMAFIFSAGMSAQETTVSVKVEKDGKVVKAMESGPLPKKQMKK